MGMGLIQPVNHQPSKKSSSCDENLGSRLICVYHSNVPIPGSILVVNGDDQAGQLWAEGRCGRDSARLAKGFKPSSPSPTNQPTPFPPPSHQQQKDLLAVKLIDFDCFLLSSKRLCNLFGSPTCHQPRRCQHLAQASGHRNIIQSTFDIV